MASDVRTGLTLETEFRTRPASRLDLPNPERRVPPQEQARILVVDDEALIRRLLGCILTAHHYQVQVAASGDEALRCAADLRPDLVILDLGLPGTSGLVVCRTLRVWLNAPILVLSGRGEEDAKIEALDGGADDYVTKPFAAGELLARIRALLRRAAACVAPVPNLSWGDLTVDVARHRVFRFHQEIRLTRTEFEILICLVENAGCVVTSKMLLERVWGRFYVSDTQALRVHVGHIRKKIEPDPAAPRYLLTECGIGYRFAAPGGNGAPPGDCREKPTLPAVS